MKKVIFMALAIVFMFSSGFVDIEDVSFLNSKNESVDFTKCDFHLTITTYDSTGAVASETLHFYNVEVGDQSCEQAGNTIVSILNSKEIS
jgi:uncharacterized protein (UPF0212 family)